MRRACDFPAINSRPPSKSSHIMLVKAFIIIAHRPMMIGKAFASVGWLRSTTIAGTGFNIDIFMSIAWSVRRRRG